MALDPARIGVDDGRTRQGRVSSGRGRSRSEDRSSSGQRNASWKDRQDGADDKGADPLVIFRPLAASIGFSTEHRQLISRLVEVPHRFRSPEIVLRPQTEATAEQIFAAGIQRACQTAINDLRADSRQTFAPVRLRDITTN